jgi:hypothetical protein
MQLNEREREGLKRLEDEEEDVSNYWMTSRKREDTGNRKRKHSIALCGELSSEDSMEYGEDRLRNHDDDNDEIAVAGTCVTLPLLATCPFTPAPATSKLITNGR